LLSARSVYRRSSRGTVTRSSSSSPKQNERGDRHVLDGEGNPVELHLVMDNYAGHKRLWSAVHGQPAGGLPLQSHSRFEDEPGRGLVLPHRTTSHLRRRVRILQRNQRQDPRLHRPLETRCHRFVWTKTAEDILKKATDLRRRAIAPIKRVSEAQSVALLQLKQRPFLSSGFM
jgi:hypothetical protein